MPDASATGSRLLLVFAALAGLLIWVTTINGAGLLPDSVHYIRMSRALGNGESVFAISKHWTPGYPLLLAWLSPQVGAELVAARWITMLSYVAAVVGLGACLLRSVGGRYAGYLTSAVLLLLLLSPAFTHIGWLALSEAPFLAALMWALYATLLLTERDSGWSLLLLCLCASMMLLLRYSAAPFVLAIVLTLAYSARNWSWTTRIKALASLTLSFVPLVVWVALHEAERAPRHLAYHPIGEAHWLMFKGTMSTWLGGLPGELTVFLVLISLVAAAFAWWRRRSPAILFCLLIIPGYLTFLCLSISFLDAQTPLDTRILAPLFPLWLLMNVSSASAISSDLTRDRVQIGGTAALMLITAVGAPAFLSQAQIAILQGVALADRRASQQEIIRYAGQLEKERAIYTNFTEWLYLHYNRDAKMLPHLYNPNTMELNPDIENDVNAMVIDLQETDGIVVWVDFIRGRPYLIDLELLTEHAGLEVVAEMQGGKVLKVRAPVPNLQDVQD